MDIDEKKIDSAVLQRLDELFHPRSIAVVGVPREMKSGRLFLIALLEQGFPGPIYPIHPEAEEIDGLRVYRNVSLIPGPVDLAIVLVPIAQTLQVVRECEQKGVKGVVLFTAGYRETGTDRGRSMERELARIARSSGMRIIGPNCMGFYSPKAGLSFFPGLSKEPGHVGIISHSGSLTNILGRTASRKGVRFSKVISLGNECDLNSAHFLAYLGNDPDTHVIGAYLEGISDGPAFLRALREASLRKPVIIWKLGLTPEGGRAAASHTGAMAGSREVWEGVGRQGGAVPVVGLEAWLDALMGFSLLTADLGDRIAIVSGPGGLAVSTAEACGSAGLRLAELSPGTVNFLKGILPPAGTSVRNPIDVGLSASMDMDIYIRSARAAAGDPGVDAVVMVGTGLTPETNRRYALSMIECRRAMGKPFLMVNIPGFEADLGTQFCDAGLPFFDSAERAMHTYSWVRRYGFWRKQRLGN